jgi:hypothetical protein
MLTSSVRTSATGYQVKKNTNHSIDCQYPWDISNEAIPNFANSLSGSVVLPDGFRELWYALGLLSL